VFLPAAFVLAKTGVFFFQRMVKNTDDIEHIMAIRSVLWSGVLFLGGCGALLNPNVAPWVEPVAVVSRGQGPLNARADACYGRDTTPAIIETVTDQVMLQPPQIDSSGRVLEPGIFITETRQQIVRQRQELWFETPCAAEDDPVFIESLQRALKARDIYRGQITGVMDTRTRRAVRQFQEPQGLDSSVLSLAAARQLGLSVWDPVAAARGQSG
jgi:hypothetical protein